MAWSARIDLNKILASNGDKEDNDLVTDVLKEEINSELRKVGVLQKFIEDVDGCITVGELDDVLENVYEEADQCKVYLGSS